MKLKYFYGSIAVVQADGYTNNLEFGTTEDDKGDIIGLNFKYPYGNISPEKAQAVSKFIKTISDAFDKLQSQLTTANRELLEEQFAPKLIESSINGAEDAVPDTAPDTESEGL